MSHIKEAIAAISFEIGTLRTAIAAREAVISKLRALEGANNKPKHKVVKRKMSKASRERIADAQRKRWAKTKREAKVAAK